MYTLPVVVPPVSHKSAVLHDKLREIWTVAERSLKQADELVVFGYSCPALDFESSNVLRRTRPAAGSTRIVRIIDPDSGVLQRYCGLLDPDCFHYYRSGHSFLDEMR